MRWIKNGRYLSAPAISDAVHYKHMIEEHGWTYRRFESEYDISNTTVSRKLFLLNLPNQIQKMVLLSTRSDSHKAKSYTEQGYLSWRQAYELTPLCKPSDLAAQFKEWYADIYQV